MQNSIVGRIGCLALAALLAGGCSTSKTASGGKTDLMIANPDAAELAHCDGRLGTVAITEAEGNAQTLTSAGLPRSVAPLARHLVLQTGCFTLVDRGAAYALLEREQRLREQQGADPKIQAMSLKSFDYLMRFEIVFAEQTGGGKGVIGGAFGKVIGGLGIDNKVKESIVMLSVVDARTSEVVASTTGRGTSESTGLGSVIFGGGALAVEGGWSDTPQAKTVAAALADAWNKTQPRLEILIPTAAETAESR